MASIRILPRSASAIFLNKEVMDPQRRGEVTPIPVCLVFVPAQDKGVMSQQQRVDGFIADWWANGDGSWDATVKLENPADGMPIKVFLHLPARPCEDSFCWTCRKRSWEQEASYRVQVL